ncbi:MAG: c-type cytochrome [Desulfobacteraceae bacterium]|nr:c-type cytochrome [Desulfobacteraceae bacterium]
MIKAFYHFMNALGYHHPVHPTEVHMPIGLVVGAFIFAIVAIIFRRIKLEATPRYCMLLAFIWVFPTMALGFMDWQYFYAGAWITPIKVKLVVAPILIVLLALGIILGKKYGAASVRLLPIYFLCLCAVTVLGYYGGQLTFGGRTIEGPRQYLAGQRIYAVSCTACHPNGGNALMPDKPVARSPLLASPQMFEFWLRHPAAPMPAFADKTLPPDKVQALYDYITSVLGK